MCVTNLNQSLYIFYTLQSLPSIRKLGIQCSPPNFLHNSISNITYSNVKRILAKMSTFYFQNITLMAIAIQVWVALMSQPYWVEVKVEVELRLRVRLSWGWNWGWVEVRVVVELRLSWGYGWGWVEVRLRLRLRWGWIKVKLKLGWVWLELGLRQVNIE